MLIAVLNTEVEPVKLTKMKTDRYYTAITILLVLLLAIALRVTANPVAISENPPLVNEAVAVEFDFEEEAYIDDIPFDTKCVSSMCKFKKAVKVNFEMEEENYVDDIPFDTEKISSVSKSQKALETEFEFDDEAYIDDIPFETTEITQVYLQSPLVVGK